MLLLDFEHSFSLWNLFMFRAHSFPHMPYSLLLNMQLLLKF